MIITSILHGMRSLIAISVTLTFRCGSATTHIIIMCMIVVGFTVNSIMFLLLLIFLLYLWFLLVLLLLLVFVLVFSLVILFSSP